MLFFAGAGLVCIIYYVIVIIYSGLTGTFSLFWLALGLMCEGIFGLGRWMHNRQIHLPGWLYGLMILTLAAGFVVFVVIEVQIIGTAFKKAEKGADYVIVLGAQVRGDVPSRTLERRVRKAAGYLKENPETLVIVSGGQGRGEDISEAQCMKQLLMDLGISEDRIFEEDTSTDTYENIKNSFRICGRDKKLVIVTCGYHMYRAKALAAKAGAVDVEGLASDSDRLLMVNYYVREFFAVLKYKVCGQI